jgi:hypothetical protein
MILSAQMAALYLYFEMEFRQIIMYLKKLETVMFLAGKDRI